MKVGQYHPSAPINYEEREVFDMYQGFKIPKVTFRIREGDVVLEEGCSFDEGKWVEKTTDDFFANKRVVLFSLPGAFTPTCTSTQLPSFEENYEKIKSKGIDEVYCCSVNDTFVMNAWAEVLSIKNVKVIPDGSGNFTRFMGMLIGKNHLGFGNRSWRYMAVINNGVVEKWWQEPGINNDGSDSDPYEQTTPENMMEYLNIAN
jgi:peroxiredoxin